MVLVLGYTWWVLRDFGRTLWCKSGVGGLLLIKNMFGLLSYVPSPTFAAILGPHLTVLRGASWQYLGGRKCQESSQG